LGKQKKGRLKKFRPTEKSEPFIPWQHFGALRIAPIYLRIAKNKNVIDLNNTFNYHYFCTPEITYVGFMRNMMINLSKPVKYNILRYTMNLVQTIVT
jgi:outer membrane protein assembly factor BamD (BamD/ComL family)